MSHRRFPRASSPNLSLFIFRCKGISHLNSAKLYRLLRVVIDYGNKIVTDMHLFRVAAWVRISGWHQCGNVEYDWRKNLNQGQELSRFLQHEAIRSNGNPPGQNTGLWQITSVPSISSFSSKIPVHGISRVSATHVSFSSLDAKMFSLCRDYCAMVTS